MINTVIVDSIWRNMFDVCADCTSCSDFEILHSFSEIVSCKCTYCKAESVWYLDSFLDRHSLIRRKEELSTPNTCICEETLMMNRGCKCGWIQIERKLKNK